MRNQRRGYFGLQGKMCRSRYTLYICNNSENFEIFLDAFTSNKIMLRLDTCCSQFVYPIGIILDMLTTITFLSPSLLRAHV